MATSTVVVFTVMATGREDGKDLGAGQYGDGVHIWRFRGEAAARQWAAVHTYYGHPSKVDREDVPRRIAQRWGMTG
jgi:hypothetical protein